MKEKYDKNSVVENLNTALNLLEQGVSRAELSNLLISTIGEGVCDLSCITNNKYFFQSILDMLPVPVYYKDIYGVYIGCNDALANLYGRSKREIIGKTVFDLFDAEEAEMFSSSDTVLLNEMNSEIIEHKGNFSAMGGNYHIIHKKVITTSVGTIAGILGIIFDATPQKEKEESVWQDEAFYKSLFEQSPRPRVIFDSFNIISDMNNSAVDFFDMGSEYIGQDITELFASYSDFERVMESTEDAVMVKILGVKKNEAIEAVASLTTISVSEIPSYAISFIRKDKIK